MSRVKELIHEIHRRSLWQVLAIYVGVSWVVLQVVEVLSETAGLPSWVGPGAIILLLLGLPIVMATAFVQEGVGGRTQPVSGASLGTQGMVTVEDSPAIAEGRSDGGVRHRLFTWRNALLGGVTWPKPLTERCLRAEAQSRR